MKQLHASNTQTLTKNMEFDINNHVKANESNGRIGRRLYFIFAILMPFISFWILNKIHTQLSHTDVVTSLFTNWILALITLSIMAMIIRLTVHRCYDFGINKWYAIFSVIPFSTLIFVLIPGNTDENSYGVRPNSPLSIVKDSFFLSLIQVNNYLKY